jgi:Rhodopirellula transposase DDE domain
MDCKATVQIGAFARGGEPRGEYKASDHDLGCAEQYIPCGIVDEDPAQLSVTFGSSAQTSAFLVATLLAGWQRLPVQEQRAIERVQLKMDHGPESSGGRTPFLHRMVQLVDTIGKPLQLLYYPRITASIIRLSVVGEFWNCIGMAPSCTLSTRCSRGPKV